MASVGDDLESLLKKAGLDLRNKSPGANGEPGAGPDFDMIWKEYQQQIEKTKQYNEQSIEIFPLPGFVCKTWIEEVLETEDKPKIEMKQDVSKVFINICHHKYVGKPEEITGPDGERQLRVPISCGPARFDKDKSGAPALVFDVIINSQTCSDCTQDREFRNLVCMFAVANIQQKNNLKCSEQLKFPKLKYKGQLPVPPQRIRKDGAKIGPLIEEVEVTDDEQNKHGGDKKESKLETTNEPSGTTSSSTVTSASNAPNISSPGSASLPDWKITPDHKVLVVLAGTKDKMDLKDVPNDVLPSTLVVHVTLPFCSNAGELDLNISGKDVVLKSLMGQEHHYELYLDFPFLIDDTKAKAKFDSKKTKLKLTFPIAGFKAASPFECDFKEMLNLKNEIIFRICD